MVARWRHALRYGAAVAACVTGCRAPHASPGAAASTAPAASALAPPAIAAPSASHAAAPESEAPPSRAKLPRLIEARELVSLPVAGFRDAVVSVPSDGSAPRLLVLALHGNFDRPEWQCQVWRRITRAEQWVLCPRGIPRRDVPRDLDRWEWGSLAATKAELVAAIAALRARYGDHVSSSPVIFTGFSLGAILGARLVQDPELDIGAAVLVEGGYQGWTTPKVKSLVPRLRRVLFACGQSECRNAYRYQLQPLFERAGLPSGAVADVKAGHTYDDPVAALVAGEWSALVAAINVD